MIDVCGPDCRGCQQLHKTAARMKAEVEMQTRRMQDELDMQDKMNIQRTPLPEIPPIRSPSQSPPHSPAYSIASAPPCVPAPTDCYTDEEDVEDVFYSKIIPKKRADDTSADKY